MNCEARTPAELARLIDSSRKCWEAGREQLYNGSIPAWLRSIGFTEHARLWHEDARKRCGKYKDAGLEAFLHIIDPDLPQPDIKVEPEAIEVSGLRPGETATVSVTVENVGRGDLSGSVELVGRAPGIKVGPPRVEANSTLKTRGRVEVEIDTRLALRGRATVRLETNAGVKDIPVDFASAFPLRLLYPFVTAFLFALLGVLLFDRFTRPFEVSLPSAAAGFLVGYLMLSTGTLPEFHAHRVVRKSVRALPALLLMCALLLNIASVYAGAPSLVGDCRGTTAVAFDPGQRSVAAADSQGTVRIWALPDGEPVREFDAGYPVRCMAYSRDGSMLAVGGRGDAVKLFHADGRGVAEELPQRGVRSLAFSPDGSLLASGGQGGKIVLWSVRGPGSRVRTMHHLEEVLTVSFSSDGRKLVSGDVGVMGLGGLVKTWDVASGREIATFRSSYWVSSACFSPDGLDLAVAGGLDRRVTIRSAASGFRIAVMDHAGWGKWVRSLDYLPDGSALVAGGGDRINVWDSSRLTPTRIPAKPGPTRVLPYKGAGRVNCVDCSPDCRWVVYGTEDGAVEVRDLAGSHGPRRLPGAGS